MLLAQLKLIKSICHHYNPNIILNYWNLVYGLVPYCYKDNFPQITHHQLKKTILQMFIELEPYHEVKLQSTFLVNCSLVEGDGRSSIK